MTMQTIWYKNLGCGNFPCALFLLLSEGLITRMGTEDTPIGRVYQFFELLINVLISKIVEDK